MGARLARQAQGFHPIRISVTEDWYGIELLGLLGQLGQPDVCPDPFPVLGEPLPRDRGEDLADLLPELIRIEEIESVRFGPGGVAGVQIRAAGACPFDGRELLLDKHPRRVTFGSILLNNTTADCRDCKFAGTS